MTMSSHHSVAKKKKKVTTDEISPAGLKAPLGGYGGAGPPQCACRVALGSPARLTEDRAETGCRESPLCGKRPKQRGQCPEVSRGMAAGWEKLHGSDSRVLMLENAQCQCPTRVWGQQVRACTSPQACCKARLTQQGW